MIDPIARLKSRRAWFVPDFAVWGEANLGQHEYLATEETDGVVSIFYGTAVIGANDQEVLYDELTDHRGNALPSSIATPRVFVRPKSPDTAFVLGTEADDRFRIARIENSASPVTVDLWIVELGH